MNHREAQHLAGFYGEESHLYTKLQQVISTVALLILGYYVLSFFDVWPSTTKRTVYELTIRLTPSRFIYFLQHVMMHFRRIPDQEPVFRRDDFGSFKAKEEAIQRIVDNSSIPNVLQRARALSGYDKLIPVIKELGPPGLGNWDNSCYQNSVLQGLASLPAFQHYVHRSRLLCQKTGVPGNTTAALDTFLDQLADASCHKQTIWTPKILKSMDSWQQQDAQEYFSCVLEAVEKEAEKYTNVINRSTPLGLGCLRSEKSESDLLKERAARVLFQTLVGNPMDGMFAQALTCQTCGFSEGVTLSQFNCLTVNLGLGGQRSLETLLDEYTEAELIEGVECDNCTRLANAPPSPDEERSEDESDNTTKKDKVKKELRVKAKQILFGRLPKDLVIHVNRSIWDDYGNQIKNPSFVQFPSRLDFLGGWCAPLDTAPDAIHAMYELKCIVTHSGRHDNGHYVAYGKRDKGWYCFNDEIVTELNENQVLTRGNVFMLFYEAIDRTEFHINEPEASIPVTTSVTEDIASPSTSSAASETYEEPSANSLQIPVPVMRTASGGLQAAESESPLGRAFVPAV